MKKEFFNMTISKINVRSISLLIALILVVSGIMMIYDHIRDEGFIDLKTPFLSGQVKSGFIGFTVIFLGIVIILGVLAISKPPRSKDSERIEIEVEGIKIICYNISYRKVEKVREIMHQLKSSKNEKSDSNCT